MLLIGPILALLMHIIRPVDAVLPSFVMGCHVTAMPYDCNSKHDRVLDLQYKHMKDEEDCEDGAHLNFETYGNLKSAVWRENPAPPSKPGLVQCDVAYGRSCRFHISL